MLLDAGRVTLRGVFGPRLITEVPALHRLVLPLLELRLPFEVTRDCMILEIAFQRYIVEFLRLHRPLLLVLAEVALVILEVQVVVSDSLLLQLGQACEALRGHLKLWVHDAQALQLRRLRRLLEHGFIVLRLDEGFFAPVQLPLVGDSGQADVVGVVVPHLLSLHPLLVVDPDSVLHPV